MMQIGMKKQADSEGEIRTRLGENARPAELDVWTEVEDADVDAADGVETCARTRACGVAGDDAEDAAGEGEATLTRTRLGADARPADADDGEAIAGVDVVGVLTRDSWWRSFAAAVPVLLWPSWASLQRTPGMLRAANLL